MIKYKYKSSLTHKYTTTLPVTETLHITKNDFIELIRVPSHLLMIENQKNRLPPHDYICFRCGQANHFIQDCPTNENELYEIKINKPTGIPKDFLTTTKQDGKGESVMVTSRGELVHTTARNEEWDLVSREIIKIKEGYKCSVCKEVMFLPHSISYRTDSNELEIKESRVCLGCVPAFEYQKKNRVIDIVLDYQLHFEIRGFVEDPKHFTNLNKVDGPDGVDKSITEYEKKQIKDA